MKTTQHNIKTVKPFSIFPYKTFGKSNNSIATFHDERSIIFASHVGDASKFLYNKLYEDLGIFISKVPDSQAKRYVQSIFSRKLLFIGLGSETKSGIIGGVSITPKNRLAGIILDSKELDLNIHTGQAISIDSWFYGTYFEFIRAAVIINESEIKKDEKLHTDMIKYLYFLMLKIIGTDVKLNDKQKVFLHFVCGYFYYRFMLDNPHLKSKELALNLEPNEYYDDINSRVKFLEKYNQMKDIFKSFVDYMIVDVSPVLLMMKILTKFKSTVFYSIISSLDYLIALSIVSYYPAIFLTGADISNDIPKTIESHMDKYLKQIKFDTESYKNI